MTQTALPPTARATGYRHEALLWHGREEFLARTLPFVAEGLAAGTTTMVALVPEQWEWLSRALGPDADKVRFVDMTTLGHNPARIMPVWLELIEQHAATGRPLRGVGSPIWAGRRDAEVVECQIHEAMLNLAIAPHSPVWLLCPYDADALGPEVLREARRSHPSVTHTHPDPDAPLYAGPEHTWSLSAQPLPAPTVSTEVLRFTGGELSEVRGLVAHRAAQAGLDPARAGDLALAVNELAANSLDHGGGRGVLHAWTEPDALVFEVRDTGQLADPLVGRVTPLPGQVRGRGLWMVNRLCDLVQIRSTAEGTVVRIHTWLPA